MRLADAAKKQQNNTHTKKLATHNTHPLPPSNPAPPAVMVLFARPAPRTSVITRYEKHRERERRQARLFFSDDGKGAWGSIDAPPLLLFRRRAPNPYGPAPPPPPMTAACEAGA